MSEIPELFGSMVFNDRAMRERLPNDTYAAIKSTIAQGVHLTRDVANVVASALKNWAVEKGATHYTHWFQPMTGVTAEKHDSFICPVSDGGIIMEFSGKELVKGEPDASSFPSGGLRATFEARGYTAWDPTSYAFIKDGTLCIPTAFCSYNGEALDMKTPLLRSMQTLSEQAVRILRLLGDKVTSRVNATVGAEQEYFLIDKEIFLKRPDLIYCGRTLFGAKPPKGQELDDHYFGAIKPRVSAFMKELNTELWKLGVLAKTEHNEVAPAQHELAPVFSTVNIASDSNQLTMEIMRVVADRHGLACLLHEKPFAGVNGSGKHINWALSKDSGVNLLEPGETPRDNKQFLLFLVAVIKAVDEFADLLRVTVASAGNDLRLGANEAPPAIVSMFLGERLTRVLETLGTNEPYAGGERGKVDTGITALPRFSKDYTDRNRTSPMAFTGNKFEFRMPGASSSVAGPNIVLNTIVAESLRGFAVELEKSKVEDKDIYALIKETICKHGRVIYNDNNYSEDWLALANERKLSNLRATVDALPAYTSEKSLKLFKDHSVFNVTELNSRYEILLENYSKTINIEALTMLDMARKYALPAAVNYQLRINDLIDKKMRTGVSHTAEMSLAIELAELTERLSNDIDSLEIRLEHIDHDGDSLAIATAYRGMIDTEMSALRETADGLEKRISREFWTLPTYGEILYSVV